jgi:hypothetical protein
VGRRFWGQRRCNRLNEEAPDSSKATISPSSTTLPLPFASAEAISGKVRVMSAPLRLHNFTASPSTTAMPRWPSYFASTAQPPYRVGGLPRVASIGLIMAFMQDR